jgi:hypothetical protein
MFPAHGRVDCRMCFANSGRETNPHPKWRMVNDPGAWGSSTPEWLVLGFSKGSTQADVYAKGLFEDIAFAGMRDRLTRALRHFSIIGPGERVDAYIADPHSRVAFGSLVRCSVSRLQVKGGVESYSCTGPIINKSFTEIPQVVRRCTERFLGALPPSLKGVMLLGNGDGYIEAYREVLRRLHNRDFEVLNPVATRAAGIPWIHLSHPSGLNGHFESWLTGDPASGGQKRIWAEEALRA